MSNKIVTIDNVKIGDKVVRGRDWEWRDQDRDSVYGIVERFYEPINNNNSKGVIVSWINYKGVVLRNSFYYRIGPIKFDLYFYK